MIVYEWAVETVDDGDVVDVNHVDTLREALALSGPDKDIVLIRNRIASDENIEDRQWAYYGRECDGLLPETFDGGTIIPKKFITEVQRSKVK